MEQLIERAFTKLEALADKLPEPKYEPEVCQRNILCECERRGCIGRTVSTKHYVRKLKDL